MSCDFLQISQKKLQIRKMLPRLAFIKKLFDRFTELKSYVQTK